MQFGHRELIAKPPPWPSANKIQVKIEATSCEPRLPHFGLPLRPPRSIAIHKLIHLQTNRSSGLCRIVLCHNMILAGSSEQSGSVDRAVDQGLARRTLIFISRDQGLGTDGRIQRSTLQSYRSLTRALIAHALLFPDIRIR